LNKSFTTDNKDKSLFATIHRSGPIAEPWYMSYTGFTGQFIINFTVSQAGTCNLTSLLNKIIWSIV